MIVQEGSNCVQLTEKATEMVRFIVSRMDAIDEASHLKVEHNCADSRIESKLTTYESESRLMRS